MRCLVTGGAGFIGGHIVEELIRRGNKVTVIDNLVTGKRENLAKVMKEIRFVEGDIRNLGLLKKEMKGIDCVFHLAALIFVRESDENPEEYYSVNVQGTHNVLEAARASKVKKFIFSSSCAVYGDTKKMPMDESLPTKPLSNYAKNKLDAEKLCKEYHNKHSMNIIILRYFNAFGPRQDPSSPYAGVISAFAKKMLRNESPTIFGDGEQTRDFVFVKNIVRANMLASKAKKGFGDIFNIGTGKETSVNNLVQDINSILKKNIKAKHSAAVPFELRRACADFSKAKRELKYSPVTDFKKGLKETVLWMKKIY